MCFMRFRYLELHAMFDFIVTTSILWQTIMFM